MKYILHTMIVIAIGLPAIADSGFASKLSAAAIDRTQHDVTYDPA